MEDFGNLIGIIAIAYVLMSLLNVTLFFKVWSMTNDTREIKETLEEWLDLEHPKIEEGETRTPNKG